MIFVLFVFFLGHEETVTAYLGERDVSTCHRDALHDGQTMLFLVFLRPLVRRQIAFQFLLEESGVFPLGKPDEAQNHHRP